MKRITCTRCGKCLDDYPDAEQVREWVENHDCLPPEEPR